MALGGILSIASNIRACKRYPRLYAFNIYAVSALFASRSGCVAGLQIRHWAPGIHHIAARVMLPPSAAPPKTVTGGTRRAASHLALRRATSRVAVACNTAPAHATWLPRDTARCTKRVIAPRNDAAGGACWCMRGTQDLCERSSAPHARAHWSFAAEGMVDEAAGDGPERPIHTAGGKMLMLSLPWFYGTHPELLLIIPFSFLIIPVHSYCSGAALQRYGCVLTVALIVCRRRRGLGHARAKRRDAPDRVSRDQGHRCVGRSRAPLRDAPLRMPMRYRSCPHAACRRCAVRLAARWRRSHADVKPRSATVHARHRSPRRIADVGAGAARVVDGARVPRDVGRLGVRPLRPGPSASARRRRYGKARFRKSSK